jgi:hypothetical protein
MIAIRHPPEPGMPGPDSRPALRRLILQLLTLFLVFAVTLLIQVVMPFRQSGRTHTLRIVLFMVSFGTGGAWVLFSLLALPRAVRGLLSAWRDRTGPRARLLSALALGLSSVPLLLILGIGLALPGCRGLRMPGRSYNGPLPALTAGQQRLRDALRGHVETLAGTIGDRNVLTEYTNLLAAASYIENTFSHAGYTVGRQSYVPSPGLARGKLCDNLEVELTGTSKPEEIVVIGAHYDSVMGCPGANDNASGVAALLELARAFAGRHGGRTLRFVAFANEEPPFFWTADMGSAVYADRCRARSENIVAMISLETIGCYSDVPHSQHYPTRILEWFYPTTGNFIGFVGNTASRDLVRSVVASFRRHACLPSQGAVLPGAISGVEWSDNWSFSRRDYPAMMVTDTAPFRYAHYHTPDDLPAQLDYDRLAYLVSMLEPVITDLTLFPPR